MLSGASGHPRSGLSPALVSVAGGWPRMESGSFLLSRVPSLSSPSSVLFHSTSQTLASCIKVRPAPPPPEGGSSLRVPACRDDSSSAPPISPAVASGPVHPKSSFAWALLLALHFPGLDMWRNRIPEVFQ